MTDREELIKLQKKAREAGRQCRFFIDDQGHIDGVYYGDRVISELSFAEIERSIIDDPKERALHEFQLVKFRAQVGQPTKGYWL